MNSKKSIVWKRGQEACIRGLICLLLSMLLAKAQLPTGTILGVVKDASGAVVPEARLVARHTDTGQTRTVLSNSAGSFRFSALPVGRYELRVEHPGFRTEVRSGLTLTVAQEAVVNFNLEVGAVEQTVAVTAEAPLVNTTSGSLGGLVDEQRVADLPLNGRNYIDLTLLQTGVQQQSNRTYTGSMTGTWLSSNGAPIRSNNYIRSIKRNSHLCRSARPAGQTSSDIRTSSSRWKPRPIESTDASKRSNGDPSCCCESIIVKRKSSLFTRRRISAW